MPCYHYYKGKGLLSRKLIAVLSGSSVKFQPLNALSVSHSGFLARLLAITEYFLHFIQNTVKMQSELFYNLRGVIRQSHLQASPWGSMPYGFCMPAQRLLRNRTTSLNFRSFVQLRGSCACQPGSQPVNASGPETAVTCNSATLQLDLFS